MSGGITIEGETAVKADLRTMANGLENLPMADLTATGVAIAKRLAPRDTGKLAASLKPDSSGDSSAVSIGVPYGKFVLGPKFRKAIDAQWQADQAVQAMVDTVTDKAT